MKHSQNSFEAHNSLYTGPLHFFLSESRAVHEAEALKVFEPAFHSQRFAPKNGGIDFRLAPLSRFGAQLLPHSWRASTLEFALLFFIMVVNSFAFLFLALKLQMSFSLSMLCALALTFSPTALSLVRMDFESLFIAHWPLFLGLLFFTKQWVSRETCMVASLLLVALYLASPESQLAFIFFSPFILIYFYFSKINASAFGSKFIFSFGAAIALFALFSWQSSGYNFYLPLTAKSPPLPIHPLQLLSQDFFNGIVDLNPVRATISHWFSTPNKFQYTPVSPGIRWILLFLLAGLFVRYREFRNWALALTYLALLILTFFPMLSLVPALELLKLLGVYREELGLRMLSFSSIALWGLSTLFILELSRFPNSWWKRFLSFLDPSLLKVPALFAFLLFFLESPPLAGFQPHLSRENISGPASAKWALSVPSYSLTFSNELPIVLNQISGHTYEVLDARPGLSKEALEFFVKLNSGDPFIGPESYRSLFECLRPPLVIFPYRDRKSIDCELIGLQQYSSFSCVSRDPDTSELTENKMTECMQRTRASR